jgi:hypothetical protein
MASDNQSPGCEHLFDSGIVSGMSTGDATTLLREAIDLVSAIDPADVGTADGLAELLEDLHRCVRRLDFEMHRLLRAFEARGDHSALGFRTAAQFCRHRLDVPGATASRMLRLGRELVFVPTVAAHWAAGEIGADHVRVVTGARTDRNARSFEEWEPWFAERSVELGLRGLQVTMKRWRLRTDPDDDGPERQERERDAHVSATFDGAVAVDATLDAIGGTAFKTVFDDLVNELFKLDWAAARKALGRDPSVNELARTAAQRRADALVLMAERARAADPSVAARLRPLVVVVTGLEGLADGLAELWDRTPLSAKQLARILAEDPDIERYVYGSGERPIAYNERDRLYTGKLRQAIQVRDRHCTALGCDIPARFCDIDHIEPASAGGRTTPENGRVACSADNRARPRRRFRGDPDP